MANSSNGATPATSADQSHHHHRCACCFQTWMHQQEDDLNELVQAMNTNGNDPKPKALSDLIETILKHLQDYADNRSRLVRSSPSCVAAPYFFSPTWYSSFENSCLWLAGCRPSLYIRLAYCLCGIDVESQLTEFLQGVRRGNLGELSAKQLILLNELHCKAIKEEEKLNGRLASMQEQIADWATLVMTSNCSESNRVDFAQNAEDNSVALAGIMEAADKLRMEICKELVMKILTPLQAAELLVAGKKLHLSLHEWCKTNENLLDQAKAGYKNQS